MAETYEETLRRQGRADACVLLFAHRVDGGHRPLNEWIRDLNQRIEKAGWSRALYLQEVDVQQAVARLKEKAAIASGRIPAPPAKPKRVVRDGDMERSVVLSAIARLGGVHDDLGHANSQLRDALPIEIDTFTLSTRLKQLADEGRITRDVRGKRTFSIQITGEAPAATTTSPTT